MENLHLEIHQEDRTAKQLRCLCHKAFVLGALVSFGMALFSCAPKSGSDSSSGSGPDGGNGVAVRLSDAPGNLDWFSRADITVSAVDAQVDDRWVNVSTDQTNLNLLDLRGGLNHLFGRIDLPSGSVKQVRLKILSASLTLTDGRVFPLAIPSGSQSGLKIFIDPALEIVAGKPAELMLDFDVSQSFVALGNPRTLADARGFLFKPVLRVHNSDVHGSNSGEVYSDNCTPDDPSDDYPIANATVEVRDRDDAVVTSNSSIGNGRFAIYGLHEGMCKLHVSAKGHASRDSDDLDERRGHDTDAGRITLAEQNCPVGGGTGTGTSVSTGTATGSGSSTATDPGASSATDTSTTSVPASSTDTATGSGSVTDTTASSSTATDTTAASATDTSVTSSTATDTSANTAGWSIFGFDATTSSTSIGVIWETQVPTTGTLRVGLSPNDLTLVQVDVGTPNTTQILSIDGMAPNTTYYLEVSTTDANGLTQTSVIIMKQTKP